MTILNQIKNKLTLIIDAVLLVFRAIKVGGGFYAAMLKIAFIFKREGFFGLWLRIERVDKKSLLWRQQKTYKVWIAKYDFLNKKTKSKYTRSIEQFNQRPLISILLPVYNPPIEFLTSTIESVINQLYTNWELCIADDCSTDPEVKKILKKYDNADPRIKITWLTKNMHISAASNAALDLARGEFVALLDHDDLLPQQALYWIASEINDHPTAKLIYSDEDKICESGIRHTPYFKPDWNINLFLSHNMICHFAVYQSQLVRSISGFRIGFEGAQDYDLALRCIEKISQSEIRHIPRILYHWRVIPGSTALNVSEKPYAMEAAKKAINQYLARNQKGAQASLTEFGIRVKYSIPKPSPLVSLIIPTKNGLDILEPCITSILEKTTYENYEIIVVDNGSTDELCLNYLKQINNNSKITVIRDSSPFNYSALNNRAVQFTNGSIIGLINNDVEVITPTWMTELVSHAVRPDVGAVGASLVYPDNTCQHAGITLGIGGVAGHAFKGLKDTEPGYFAHTKLIQTYSAVTGACLFIKKSIYLEVGGLNEKELTVAFNDVDFCIRIGNLGYQNIWTPYAKLYHYESKTRGAEDSPAKVKRFKNEIEYMRCQWGELIDNDPFYNPNLSVCYNDYSLAFPPRISQI